MNTNVAEKTSLPDMTDEQYRVFNKIRHQLNFDDMEVSYHLDADEWRDQLGNIGTLVDDNVEQSIHCSSSISYNIRMGQITLHVTSLCGVYLSEKSLFANELDQPEFRITVANCASELKKQVEGEIDEEVGTNLFDLAQRNIKSIVPQDSDWISIENQFRLDLMKHFDVAPSKLYSTLLAELDQA